jgi:integrase
MVRRNGTSGELTLTRDEYNKLLLVCDDQQDKLLLMLCVSLGFRRSDVVNIQINNLNFNAKTITYNEKKKHNRIRVVPMSPKLENELKIFINLSNKKISDKLFSFGERQSLRRFNSLCDKAKIPRRPINCLRATCCKFYLESGANLNQISAIVGDLPSTIAMHYITPSILELQSEIKEVI